MNSCKAFQEQIQNFLDDGKSLTPELNDHLAECATCRNFYNTFHGMNAKCKNELNKKTKNIQKFVFENIGKKENKVIEFKKASVSYARATAAAVIVVAVMSGSTMLLKFNDVGDYDPFIIAENKQFVEEVFNISCLIDIDSESSVEVANEWFQDIGLVEEILGDFELN